MFPSIVYLLVFPLIIGNYIPPKEVATDVGEHDDSVGKNSLACDSCCEASHDTCSDLLNQLSDMEKVLDESGCDMLDDEDGIARLDDVDKLCNAVARNAIASCMLVMDEEKRDECMNEVELDVQKENVGVTIDDCECYNFKKIYDSIVDSIEVNCPSERNPMNEDADWVTFRQIWIAYSMCYYRNRPRWCQWWRRLAEQQAAIIASGGTGIIPVRRKTRPVRPGNNCVFCTMTIGNGFSFGLFNR